MKKPTKFKYLPKYGEEKVVSLHREIPLSRKAKIVAYIRQQCMEVEQEVINQIEVN